jgi:hypothetical protein
MENRRSIAAIRSQVLQQPAGSPNKEGTGKPSFMFFVFGRDLLPVNQAFN